MKNTSSSDAHQPACGCCGARDAAPPPRRGFFASAAAVVLGAAALAGPVAVGLVAFLNPLRQKKQAGKLVRVATLDALPADGTPRKFPVIADRTDAWTLYKDVPIGSVFLRLVEPNRVEALSVVCPHAGCFIAYDAAARDFVCPCHAAHFDLDGRRTDQDSKSPRDMDSLPGVEIRGAEIWVQYETFRTGIAEKVVQS
ncbi:MAG: Rieske 2Fe-2S domain-containing protein [Pirellulales bacterium]|nr:Rieske 2Fe-2S domain-containing protein [Pirellulales bacterium]